MYKLNNKKKDENKRTNVVYIVEIIFVWSVHVLFVVNE